MKIAIVSAWPEVKNAEYECIERIKIAAKNNNAECIVVDNEGYIIGHNDKRTDVILYGDEVEFVIALHFVSEKLYNTYTYGAMWNPPKFLADWDYANESIKYFSYDDYLIYDSAPIVDHIKNLLLETDRDLTNAIHFVPSVPGEVMTPHLSGDLRLFYSGINWERISNSKGRHHDLFKALDDEHLTRIYGPEKFFDAVPWAGFQTYAGSLPFDGLSTIKAINECGVSLVLSSNTHREAEAATNRLYESCAAGVVLICDDNPFVIRQFGDSVLYIQYDENNHMKNLDQIKSHLKWIKENPKLALELAHRSQAIYVEKFHLDKILANLIKNHSLRKKEVISLTCDTGTNISVIYRIIDNKIAVNEFIISLNMQYNASKIDLIILCDHNVRELITNSISAIIGSEIQWKVISLPLFDKDGKVIMTTGQMLVIGLDNAQYDYVAVIDQNRVLFDDHFSLGLKQFQNQAVSMTYTGTCVHDYLNDRTIIRYKNFFGNYHLSSIAKFVEYVDISSLIFKKSIIFKYQHHLAMMDGYEVYSIMLASFLSGEWKFTYKVTMAVQLNNGYDKVAKLILEDGWQSKLVSDAFKYNQKISDVANQNIQYMDISKIDMKSFEVLLKKFLKSKIETKYPKLLSIIKKIYNKVFK